MTSAMSVPGFCPRYQEPMVIVTVPGVGGAGAAIVGDTVVLGGATLTEGVADGPLDDGPAEGVPDGDPADVGVSGEADAEGPREEGTRGEGGIPPEGPVGVELAAVVVVSCGPAAAEVTAPATTASAAAPAAAFQPPRLSRPSTVSAGVAS